jgi:glycerophosphoryl diester phosphodiesterase
MLETRPSHGVTSVIAHRGASRVERENTVAAFRQAAELGADMVELDVRRSADGVLVVHHDAYLGDGRAVSSTPAAELPEWVPTLEAALDACAGMAVNIEIKNDPAEPGFEADRALSDDVAAVVAARGDTERVLVSSFDRPSLDRLRAVADPPIATAWLVTAPPTDVVDTLVAGGHQALHPWWQAVDRSLVERCHTAGLAVNVWTCDDALAMARLASWGVDGICTNVPDVAVAVLADPALRERSAAPDP